MVYLDNVRPQVNLSDMTIFKTKMHPEKIDRFLVKNKLDFVYLNKDTKKKKALLSGIQIVHQCRISMDRICVGSMNGASISNCPSEFKKDFSSLACVPGGNIIDFVKNDRSERLLSL